MAKGAIKVCIWNLAYALLMLLLLSVYHLFIRLYIFKDWVGRNNVWNLVYGDNLDIFSLGKQAIELGERFARGDWRRARHYD